MHLRAAAAPQLSTLRRGLPCREVRAGSGRETPTLIRRGLGLDLVLIRGSALWWLACMTASTPLVIWWYLWGTWRGIGSGLLGFWAPGLPLEGRGHHTGKHPDIAHDSLTECPCHRKLRAKECSLVQRVQSGSFRCGSSPIGRLSHPANLGWLALEKTSPDFAI